MTDIKTDFFVTGGTLRRDALSYIVRDADEKVYDGLLKGEFCYVLTPRQMGKSSLMVRTAVRLGDAGVTVAVLDLTGIGSNLTAEQWYEGLLNNIGTQLDLEDELDDYWDDNAGRSPLQRWLGAVRKIVLPTVEKQLVIFVDEIDMVRSLPFSTDEFFASIREFHNSRSINADSDKITFCLLGVAAPADLISNPLITPFNIGSRIELKDFTDAQSEQLAEGVNKGDSSLEIVGRVLHWTGGHPYLTQKMCQSISSKDEIRTVNQVDDLCHKMFLSSQARDKDINLSFVRDRMLKSDDDIATLLDIYSRVYKDMHVPANEKNPVFDTLILSGIVRINDGEFRISNRIYKHVFDKGWVVEHMPGAELRRQKREFWRGVIRTAAVAVIVIGIIAGLAVYSIVQRERALRGELLAKQYLYDAEINLANIALESGNLGRAYELLNKNSKPSNGLDFRNWEWYHLWGQCKNDFIKELGAHENSVRSVSVSPDGLLLATCSIDNTIHIVNLVDNKKSIIDIGFGLNTLQFHPVEKKLAFAGWKGYGFIDTSNDKFDVTIKTGDSCGSVTYSDNAEFYALIINNSCRVYKNESEYLTIDGVGNMFGRGISFSSNNKYIVTRHRGGTGGASNLSGVPVLYDLIKKKEIKLNYTDLPEDIKGNGIATVKFKNDKSVFLAAHWDGYISFWDAESGKYLSYVKGHDAWVSEIVFSPDGNKFYSCAADQSIKIWNSNDKSLVATLTGHRNEVWAIALSIDGRFIYSGSKGGKYKVWDAKVRDNNDNTFKLESGERASFIVNNAEHHITLGENDQILIRNTDKFEELIRLNNVNFDSRISVSSDLKKVSYINKNQNVVVYNINSKEELILPDITARSLVGNYGTSITSFAPNSESLRILSPNGLIIYNSNSNKVTLEIPSKGVVGIAYSNNNRKAVFFNEGDKVARYYNLETQSLILELKGHAQQVVDAVISDDNSLIATASFDATTRLWDANTGRNLAIFKGQLLSPHSVMFTKDGKRLFVGTGEGTVKVWDIATKNELMTLDTKLKTSVRKIYLKDNGNLLLLSGFSGNIFSKYYSIK